ncbi:MAG: hypothetical protein KC877_05160 [Candidatus Kaiserbacteria bacterium]|nr:hypothetical protein [Candidatus Kaiserbacteria bacterium]MCB9816541.1 hypothetical protein [Candidatus Nomurabacteria bacterium]
MLFLSIVHHYLLWHYSRAFLEIFNVWLNLIWFIIHFFSLPQLFRTWFSPWKRIIEDRGDKWNFEDLAAYLIIGLISRIIGFIMRTFIIAAGLIALALIIVAGFATYLFWIVAPLAIVALLILGVSLLFA